MTAKKKHRLKLDTNNKAYGIEDSVFFKLKSKKKLAGILRSSVGELKQLSNDANYNRYEEKSSGKPRNIEHPTGRLEVVHTRIASLLCRIEQPYYVHSGIKGRSYLSNARMHVGSHPVLVTDLKSFFQNTKKQSAFYFFYNVLECSPDVAEILSNLCTCDNHIPTGSRISMPLAFWSNALMFKKLAALSELNNITMTVFVDDLTFSGHKVTRQFKQRVRKIISEHSHAMHSLKTRLYLATDTKIITGVAVTSEGINVANRHHRSIYEDMEQWIAIRDSKELLQLKGQLTRRLLGKLNSQAQIDCRFKDKARTVKTYT